MRLIATATRSQLTELDFIQSGIIVVLQAQLPINNICVHNNE